MLSALSSFLPSNDKTDKLDLRTDVAGRVQQAEDPYAVKSSERTEYATKKEKKKKTSSYEASNLYSLLPFCSSIVSDVYCRSPSSSKVQPSAQFTAPARSSTFSTRTSKHRYGSHTDQISFLHRSGPRLCATSFDIIQL